MSTTTFTGAPPADRFRNGDVWRAPDGTTAVVCTTAGLAEPLCILRSVGWGGSTLRERIQVARFTRIRWGGQP